MLMLLLPVPYFVLIAILHLPLGCRSAPVVQLGHTNVVGRVNFVRGLPAQEFFGGIPFAEPPVGELRFAPPILKTGLDVHGTFQAGEYGRACPQIPVATNANEDCLTVDILRPAGVHAGSALPVFAWIFGGGFANGDSSLYNASAIVLESVLRGTPIIHVGINYRLGPFGFPQGLEAQARGALNLGLKDQLTALEWIHHNIRAFGGDPSKVTVGGGSAGAMSIANLYLTSGLERFVRGAIFQSGSQSILPLLPASRREQEWQNFVAATPECVGSRKNDTFECLRKASMETLTQSYGGVAARALELFPFTPVIDGPGGLIPELPSKMLSSGRFSRIPFIAGTNLDEGTLFVPVGTSSVEDITRFLALYADPLDTAPGPSPALSRALAHLVDLYPDVPALGSPYGTENETFGLGSEYKRVAAIAGDIALHATRRAWTQHASRVGVRVFCYLFSDPQAVVIPSQGVAHGTEVSYVYGAPFLAGGPQPAATLSHAMLDYWISFVASLDPNDGRGSLRPLWKAYTPSEQVILQLRGGDIRLLPDTYRAKQLAFINSSPDVYNH